VIFDSCGSGGGMADRKVCLPLPFYLVAGIGYGRWSGFCENIAV
jgi:hypothetical protein